MGRFKIGQKVVCVDAVFKGEGISANIKKGAVYIVNKNLKNCCYNLIDIGIVSGSRYMRCNCGIRSLNIEKLHWLRESRFAPLEEDGSAEKLTCEIKQETLEELKIEEMELN